MLRLENVRKEYKDFTLDCTMEVPQGCVTGLIGKNGAGKTTAFKACLGLVSIDGGTAEIFGKPVAELSLEDREEIGTVLSDSGFSGYITAREAASVLDSLYGRFDRQDFLRRCEEFQLPLDKKLKDFSTGMKRKIHVLAAISHDAKLLILDEPTAGLDVVARDELLGLLREYMEAGDRSVLISSHISSDLEGFCDDIYMIDHGKIILHEETDVLTDRYGLLKVTQEQYEALDKSYLLRSRKEEFGYSCLTDQKQFYLENYPQIAVEKGTIDKVIMMMAGGKK